jgi:hypothetical protein
MRPHGLHLGRRAGALALAYLLALQVILTAWAVIAPAAAAVDGLGVICTTHADGAAPAPGGSQPATCPCGPMCLGGCCPTVGASAASATPVVFRIVAAAVLRPLAEIVGPRRVASAPEQARAPPVLASSIRHFID